MPRHSRFIPGKKPVPIVQEAGWAPVPVWTGAENLAPTSEFYPRTFQPVAIRCTDWAIATHGTSRVIKFINQQKQKWELGGWFWAIETDTVSSP